MNRPSPLLVGITGGIGAGKTTVAKIFSLLSVPVYYADDRAKWLMANHGGLKTEILKAFGQEAFLEGSLNRPFLANYVFSDKEKTEQINGMVHPVVRENFIQWASSQKSPYVLKEAALLFETGSYKELDKIIHITSPLETRISRILMRDPHRSAAQIQQIIDLQLPDEIKNEKADFIVKNQENLMLIPQVLAIHEALLKEVELRK